MAALAEQHERFVRMGCDVVTVSTNTIVKHREWREQDKELARVEYPMGSDPTGALGRMFGVYDAGSGLDLRGTFFINPDGVLLGSEVNFYNLGRNIDEMMRKFKANLYLSRKTDDACPSTWKNDGDPTMVNPDAKMDGTVHEAQNG